MKHFWCPYPVKNSKITDHRENFVLQNKMGVKAKKNI
jgi:hypothetical protein